MPGPDRARRPSAVSGRRGSERTRDPGATRRIDRLRDGGPNDLRRVQGSGRSGSAGADHAGAPPDEPGCVASAVGPSALSRTALMRRQAACSTPSRSPGTSGGQGVASASALVARVSCPRQRGAVAPTSRPACPASRSVARAARSTTAGRMAGSSTGSHADEQGVRIGDIRRLLTEVAGEPGSGRRATPRTRRTPRACRAPGRTAP